MKAKEIRRRTSTDLAEEIKRLGTAVFDSRFRSQSEEKTDRGLVRRTRREVARIKTILRERELGLSPEPASGKAAVPETHAEKAPHHAKRPAAKKVSKRGSRERRTTHANKPTHAKRAVQAKRASHAKKAPAKHASHAKAAPHAKAASHAKKASHATKGKE